MSYAGDEHCFLHAQSDDAGDYSPSGRSTPKETPPAKRKRKTKPKAFAASSSRVDLIARLKGVRRSGNNWTAKCPAHQDRKNSLSVTRGDDDDRWLVHCHAGCSPEQITAALGIGISELFDGDQKNTPLRLPQINRATVQPRPIAATPDTAAPSEKPTGITLEAYAAAKALPVDFLKVCGVRQINHADNPALRIPYLSPDGQELAIRLRIALDGDRFRWKSGTKPQLYGLNRLEAARAAGYVALCEGESDCHTLWLHDIPAIGLPGATNWNEARDAKYFEGITKIYVVIEDDRGGAAVREWLARSTIRSRAHLLQLPMKDPSAMHVADPVGFKAAWHAAILSATSWAAIEAKEQAESSAAAWTLCADLARCPNILERLEKALDDMGVAGERNLAKIIYLAVTSRFFDRPANVAIKGPSSSGKSYIVEIALRFFPAAAFYALTGLSDRALAYSTEPLKHRFLVVYEAAGMNSDFATYLIRSLLSEGRLRYETVESTKDGLVPRLIEREGPTGLITTTTSIRLHPENETRLISLSTTDTAEQTAAIFEALAEDTPQPDLSEWQALQAWLAASPGAVVIPFASALAKLVKPVAVRLRRDFKLLLTLVRAHALLHQVNRKRDADGRLIAELSDYAPLPQDQRCKIQNSRSEIGAIKYEH